jgi:hypothetical protein
LHAFTKRAQGHRRLQNVAFNGSLCLSVSLDGTSPWHRRCSGLNPKRVSAGGLAAYRIPPDAISAASPIERIAASVVMMYAKCFPTQWTGFTCPTSTVRQIALAYESHTARVCEIHLLRRTRLEPNILSLSGPCRSGPFLLVPCLSGPSLRVPSLHFFLLTVFCVSGPCLPGPCLDRDRDRDQEPGPGPGQAWDQDRLTGWLLGWWAGSGRRVGR